MRGISLRYKGDKELRNALNKKIRLEAIKHIIKRNGADLQQKAQINAPVDTGTLKRSIVPTIEDNGLTARVKAGAEYAPYVEYGTRYMTAKPYMKPAFFVQKEIFKQDLKKITK